MNACGMRFFLVFFPDAPVGVGGDEIVFFLFFPVGCQLNDSVRVTSVLDFETYLVTVVVISLDLEYMNVFNDIAWYSGGIVPRG